MLVKICLFYFEVNITFWVKKGLLENSTIKVEFILAVNKFFSLMSWMDTFVLLLCPDRFLLGGREWPNILAASL